MREISLLGMVRVESCAAELPRFRSQRAMALLGYLAIERRPLMRTHLATLFWPDDTPERGKTKLRRELYNLAQILPNCWEADRLKVHFIPSAETTVDLDTIRQLEKDEKWQAAAVMLRGDFLEGLFLKDNYEFETWLLGERERWRQHSSRILTFAANDLEGQGSYRRALRHAQRLLQLMPWREETHRHVMRLLALSDQRSAALKQFEICKQLLWDELGVEPSVETLTLYERIRRSPHYSRDNIPATSTPLIGREEELETLSRHLANPDVRLLTITGLGGMGKTRLALDLAWRHTKGQFRDGVTFVQLAALKTAGLLVSAIARALHLPLQAADEQGAHKELLNYLKPKQHLLVLDNCEHLLDGMTLAVEILEAAPHVQILATSRERLRLRAEYVFPLPGLLYDDRRDHPAAQLFQGTAQRIAPEFEITAVNSAHVNRLCRMVDGIPLALELAAGTLDRTSVAALADEIETGLDTLVSDLRDIPARHRSLRTVLEATWNRLQPRTGEFYAALSGFRGSFSPDAALEVAGASPELLKQLVAHSLLEYDQEADRCRLHEMLQQFAAEKLAGAPERERTVRKQHFLYYNDLAHHGGAALRGGDQELWLGRLELEQSNIQQAIDWAAENDIEAAAHLTVSLHIYWFTKGLNQEAANWCERLILHGDYLSRQIYPWLLAIYAEALLLSGNPKDAVFSAYEALLLFIKEKDHAGLTFTYSLLTTTARRMSDDLHISTQLGEAGLQFASTSGSDSYYTSLLLESLSDTLIRSNRFDEADAHTKRGYNLCIQRNDRMSANYLLAQMSFLALMRGHLSEARQYAEKCLHGSRQFRMLVSEHLALEKLMIIAVTEGNLDQAEQYVMDRLVLAREANFPYYLAGSLLYMGSIQMDQGRFPEALPYLQEAAARFQEIGDRFFTAAVIKRLSQWMWHEDKVAAHPARWLACAEAEQDHQLNTPIANTQWASFKSELEASLGEEAFARVWAEGQKISVEEAMEEISLALSEKPTGL